MYGNNNKKHGKDIYPLAYAARIGFKGEEIFCGYWSTARLAARARDNAILKYKINKPLQTLRPK